MLKYSFDLSDFNNYMGGLNRQTEKAVSKALDDVVEVVYNLARPNVPHDTGDLLDSWRIEIRSELEVLAGYDTEYAMYQHQGRRKDGTHIIRNRPAGGKSFFLKKAIDENHDLILNEIYKRTQKYLKI